MRHRFLIAAGLLLAAAPAALFGANSATLGGTSGLPGEKITLSLSLGSDAPAAGVQLSMVLPEGTAYAEGSATAGGRASAMSASGGVRDGRLNLTLYSLGTASIAAGEGDVLTFDLVLGDTPLRAALSPQVIMAGADGEAVGVDCPATDLTIRGAALKPVNRELSMGRVALGESVTTSVLVANSGTEPLVVTGVTGLDNWRVTSPATIQPESTGYVSLAYVPGVRGQHDEIVRLESNASGSDNPFIVHAEGYGRNEVSLAAQDVNGGEESTVSVSLKNYDPICGFTLRVLLPRNFSYVPGSFALSDERADGQGITSTAKTDDDGVTTLTLTSYSFSNKAFKGKDGVVATFRVLAASRYGATISIDKAVLPTLLDGVVTDVVSATSNSYMNVTSPTFNISRDNNLGRTPVTAEYAGTVSFSNYGNAPLVITGWECEDEAMLLTTELPLTLNSWNWSDLTFKRTDATRGVLTRTVKLHSNDPEAPVLAVNVTMDRYSPNELSLTAEEVDEADDEVTFSLALDNNDPAEGLQFDIVYDPALEGTVKACAIERASGFVAQVSRIEAGRARVMAYGLCRSIAVGAGPVLTLTFAPETGLQQGSYPVAVSNVVIGDKDMMNIHSAMQAVAATATVNPMLLGDANRDGRITVVDLNLLYNHLMSPEKSTVRPKVIDMDGDGNISVTDLNLHIDKLINHE